MCLRAVEVGANDYPEQARISPASTDIEQTAEIERQAADPDGHGEEFTLMPTRLGRMHGFVHETPARSGNHQTR
jgi:hypothetical protein